MHLCVSVCLCVCRAVCAPIYVKDPGALTPTARPPVELLIGLPHHQALRGLSLKLETRSIPISRRTQPTTSSLGRCGFPFLPVTPPVPGR
jgi:hypothetical protein